MLKRRLPIGYSVLLITALLLQPAMANSLPKDVAQRRSAFEKELDDIASRSDQAIAEAERAYRAAIEAAEKARAAALEKARRLAEEKRKKEVARYVNYLETRMKEETRQGELDRAISIRDERDRVEKEKEQPTDTGPSSTTDTNRPPISITRRGNTEEYRHGLLCFHYARTRRQLQNPRVLESEDRLGDPVRVQASRVDANGELHFDHNRTLIAKGFILVKESGEYGFTIYGHYTGEAILQVGDKTTIRQSETNNGEKVTFVRLRRGLVPINVMGRLGNRKVRISWKPPGSKELIPISNDDLYYKVQDKETGK